MARDRVAVVLAVSALLLAACTSGGGSGTPPEEKEPTRTAADARADLLIAPADDLPEGWERVPARERLASSPGAPRYCGVVAEPDPVEEGRIAYYEAGDGIGGSVLQYGLLSTEEAATRTLDALLAVREDCLEPGHTVTPVPADELAGVGDQAVAWDFVKDDDPSVRFRTLVSRRGDTVVVLVATGVARVPTAEQLAIARVVDERVKDD